MKKDLPYLPCVGVGLATCFGVWFLIGPLGGVFGLYLEQGAIVLLCLTAAIAASLLFRAHQRLNLLELRVTYLLEKLDKPDPN